MQIVGFALFSATLVVTHAADLTILDTLFKGPDANNNSAWEIEEITRYFGVVQVPVWETLVISLFKELNTNGDLQISTEEFKGFCAKLLGGVFKLLDPNSDGFITSVEMLSGDGPTNSNSGLPAIFFNILDVNKDGFLSTEDAFPQGYNYDHNNSFLDLLDENKDGVIGLKEYNQKHFLFGLPEAPAQLVKLYNKIDKNADDKFTLKEIEVFLTAYLEILDANSDGVITLEEQVTAFTQAGVPQTLAEMPFSTVQKMFRSSDHVNQLIAILDTNNDDKVSQAEVTDILDYPYMSPKIMQLVVLNDQMHYSNTNTDVPEDKLTGEQALVVLGRFLDNPRFD